jgi:hypothetical protein
VEGCGNALTVVKPRTIADDYESAMRNYAKGEDWTVDDLGRDLCRKCSSR